jgi:long-chain acyl-CoA synthetase
MYTSGSTGNPKGVMISHANLIVGSNSFRTRLGHIKDDDALISYLPLAHVLELCSEITCLFSGCAIGYSSPQTMADTSTAIKKSQKGDLRMLKPTIMCAVPIILERLSKTVYEKLAKTDWFTQTLFKKAFTIKLRRFRRGASTRLLDRLLFNSIKSAVLGGKVRMIVSGGAILSKEVHEFTQVVLAPTFQAYGLTETTANGTSQFQNQTENETVGSVLPACEIRLVDWAEAGKSIFFASVYLERIWVFFLLFKIY